MLVKVGPAVINYNQFDQLATKFSTRSKMLTFISKESFQNIVYNIWPILYKKEWVNAVMMVVDVLHKCSKLIRINQRSEGSLQFRYTYINGYHSFRNLKPKILPTSFVGHSSLRISQSLVHFKVFLQLSVIQIQQRLQNIAHEMVAVLQRHVQNFCFDMVTKNEVNVK